MWHHCSPLPPLGSWTVSYHVMRFKRTTAEHQYINVTAVEEYDEQLQDYPAEKTPIVEENESW